MVPELEAEITKLGRSFGGSSVAMPAERETERVPKLPT
jgi:hypothetical protein